MHQKGLKGSDCVIDIENGGVELSKDGAFGSRHPERLLDGTTWDGFPGNVGCCGEGRALTYPSNPVVVPAEDLVGDNKFGGGGGGEENGGNLAKKQKKKNCKKPPKPPRPPKAPSLDEADQKLIREITELAMLRRARIERMKALKKMKNTKTTSSSVNAWAFIVTAIFCFMVLWQGFCSRSSSELGFEGSPVSSLRNNGGLISVQYYRSTPDTEASLSSSASPNIVGQVSGSDTQDESSILTRPSR